MHHGATGLLKFLVYVAFSAILSDSTTAQQAPHNPRFAYVPNYLSHNITGFSLDPATGTLKQLPRSPFPTGRVPAGVAATPNSKFLFIAVSEDDAVWAYSITSTGNLVLKQNVSTGTSPGALIVHPSGKYLYVANCNSNNISAFRIGSKGRLSKIAGSPFSSGTCPGQLATDPLGNFLYSGNVATVSAYSIDSATGQLKIVEESVPAGPSQCFVATDYTGKFLYSANNEPSGDFYGFGIDSSGSLNLLSGFPFYTGLSQRWAISHPSAPFLYIAENGNRGMIAGYLIDAGTGMLSAISGSPFRAGTGTISVTVSSTGRFLYAANNYSNNISGYKILSGGGLSPVPGSPFKVAKLGKRASGPVSVVVVNAQ